MVEQGGFTTLIPREIFMAINGAGNTDTKPIQTDTKPIQNLSVVEQREYILDTIRRNPMVSMDCLSEHLSITKSSVQRRLDALVKEGKIKHNGPTKGGFWEIIE